MTNLLRLSVSLWLLAVATLASAAEPSPAFTRRVSQLPALFNGEVQADALFSTRFLEAVPKAQVDAISGQMRQQFGRAIGVGTVAAQSPTTGSVSVEFERGRAQFGIVVGEAPPNLIEGLRITGTEPKGDSLAAIVTELRALPGVTALSVSTLGPTQAGPLIAHEAGRPLAIGSAFKLFILAELSRSVKAGERKWSDVVPLDRRSVPSGRLQDWPQGAPMTLHTLAALMISQSDNTATDVLLHAVGREKVEALLPTLGIAAPERNRPFLSTLELTVLKAGEPALAAAWTAADEKKRRAMLAGPLAAARAEQVDLARLMARPNRIDSIEWFASTSDLVQVTDWLRVNADPAALDILAINPGIGRDAAGRFAYLGFKGGSEIGVINLSFLLRGKDGRWHAIAATWNDEKAAVDGAKFVALISRAVALLR